MKLEFKLTDGTKIIGDEEMFKQIADNFKNNKLSTSSLLSVVCFETKIEYIFTMSNVVYVKVIP